MPTNFSKKKILKEHNSFFYGLQHYRDLTFSLIEGDYNGRKAMRYLITNHSISFWIPKKHLTESGKLKESENIDYVFKQIEESLNKVGLSYLQDQTYKVRKTKQQWISLKGDNLNHIASPSRTHSLCGISFVFDIDDQSGFMITEDRQPQLLRGMPKKNKQCMKCLRSWCV